MTTISPAAAKTDSLPRNLKIAAAILICFGAAVRVRQYQARTSFWYDEAEVLWNVRNLSARQIVGFLHYKQVAPPLFMLQLKAMSNIAGNGEFSMHLESTVCSLVGLAVVSVLAWRLLPAPGAVFCIGLFALARRLAVEYAAMVKQYEGDAMVSALLLLVALWDPDSPPLPRLKRVRCWRRSRSGYRIPRRWFSRESVWRFACRAFVEAGPNLPRRSGGTRYSWRRLSPCILCRSDTSIRMRCTMSGEPIFRIGVIR